MNEHLCFCTDANDTQQVTTRCIIAPYFIGGSERSAFRERHAPSLQVPARLPVDGMKFSAAPSPDDAENLPGIDGQIDLLQGVDRRGTGAEGFVQIGDLNDGFLHGHLLFSLWCGGGTPSPAVANKKVVLDEFVKDDCISRGTTLVRAAPRGTGLRGCQHTPAR